MTEDLNHLVVRLHGFLDRAERLLPDIPAVNWSAPAFHWRRQGASGWLEAILLPPKIRLENLRNIDAQKAKLTRNTAQFLAGRSANNALLTGARGCGKSSLVKALLHEYHGQGLRLIEIDKEYLGDLAQVQRQIAGRPERFIVFCDDLSFDEGDAAYKALKVALDGSLLSPDDNLLIYATSNRRHLLPEYHEENARAVHIDGEIHPGEAIDEKISLSERFGLWLSFYPFDQQEYLTAVQQWLTSYGVHDFSDDTCRAALQWAQGRGTRSGRTALQFARDWAGRL